MSENINENDFSADVNIPILISDACKLLNMEAHVLRYWEEELELTITRNDQGYRCYTQKQLLIFQRIKLLRDCGYQLKAIKLIVPRLALLDDDEFYYITKLADEMNLRASEIADTLPKVLPCRASETELARKLRLEEFEDVMNRILDNVFSKHSARLQRELSEAISTRVIKEINYLMRLRDEEEELRFRRLDDALTKRRHSNVQNEAAASRFPWKRRPKKE